MWVYTNSPTWELIGNNTPTWRKRIWYVGTVTSVYTNTLTRELNRYRPDQVALVLAFVLLLLLAVWCWLVALVLVFVLAPPAPLLQCVFAQCQIIFPNFSLQDWHALLLDKEPWFDSSTGSSLAAAHGADS